jgi:predicted phage tail protein
MGLAQQVAQAAESNSTNSSSRDAIDEMATMINTQTGAIRDLVAQTAEMREELRRLRSQVSVPGSATSESAASVSGRLHEIEQTLTELVPLLNGQQLSAARSRAVQANMTLTKTTDRLCEAITAHQQQMATTAEDTRAASLQVRDEALGAIKTTAAESSNIVTVRLDETSARAERLIEAARRLERRQLWTGVGVLGLALIPVATICAVVGVFALLAVTAGSWVLALVTAPDAWWASALAGLAVLALLTALALLLLKAAFWLDGRLSDAIRRFRR